MFDVIIERNTTGKPARGSFKYNNTTILSTAYEPIIGNFSIYPNPSNNFINIRSDKDRLQKIELYSITGSLIFKTDVTANTYALNIANYSIGTYLLRIINQNNERIQTKIIKK